MPVGEMLDRMPAQELREWMAFASLEPIGEARGDWRAAQVAQMLVAVNMGKGKKPPPIADFLLRFGEPTEAEAEAEVQAKRSKVATSLSGLMGKIAGVVRRKPAGES